MDYPRWSALTVVRLSPALPVCFLLEQKKPNNMTLIVFCAVLTLLVALNATVYAQDLSDTKIAFVSFRDGDFEIYVMDTDGTN